MDEIEVRSTASATTVLCKMRHASKTRTVWIDAICINQQDDSEKGGQVAMMGKIYQKGFSNFIWLGEVPNARRTEDAMRNVLSNIARSTKDPSAFRALMAGEHGAAIHDGKTLKSAIDWSAIQELYEQPWFQRLWVAQEAALAPESVCHFGDSKLPLNDVLDVAAWLIYNRSCLPPEMLEKVGLYAARAMWYILDKQGAPETDLFAAFIMAQNFQAREPKDHVYALRSLYRDRQPKLRLGDGLLHPKYDKAVTKYEVFRNATRASIEDSQRLDILQFVDPSETPRKWPSWILHFDVRTNLDKDPICQTGSSFAADADTDRYPPKFVNLSTLEAYGIKFDRVDEVSVSFSRARAWETEEHGALMNQVRQMVQKQRSRLDWREALGTTLVAGGLRAEDKTNVDDFVAFWKYSLRNPKHPPVAAVGQKTSDDYAKASRWFKAYEATMYGRRFFMTGTGYPGIGPVGMERGDLIALLCGGSVPFVLRPRRCSGAYELVGVCYVLGIMNGEATKHGRVECMNIV
ncbi:unnamed protein product [Cercospora beticola]|nr:unnamed protein product [Cercospora beticola]